MSKNEKKKKILLKEFHDLILNSFNFKLCRKTSNEIAQVKVMTT